MNYSLILTVVRILHSLFNAVHASSVANAVKAQVKADLILDKKAAHEQVAGLAKSAVVSLAGIVAAKV